MIDWLKILGLTIISPSNGLSEAYARSPFLISFIFLFVTQTLFSLYSNWSLLLKIIGNRFVVILFGVSFKEFVSSLVLNVVFVPTAIAISNFFERRGSPGQVVQQEFSAVASTVNYAYTAVHLLGLVFIFIAKQAHLPSKFAAWYANTMEESRRTMPALWKSFDQNQIKELVNNADALAPSVLFQMIIFPVSIFFLLMAVRAAFRMEWHKTLLITMGGGIAMFFLGFLVSTGVGFIIGSPFLLLLTFFLLQGYVREIGRRRQAQIDFKRNLEISTLNPADASAHYNLGLLYQQRKDYGEARKSFEKTVEIDSDEVDAHYQLGRIARQENRLQDAINNFGQVVLLNQRHSQHEIWREIGATYLSANQFADAKDALEKFLDERPSDPEGLYLMGQIQSGLGNKQAAVASMKACIEAVKTSPAFKYRLEKRWLNEAEKFLKSI